MSETIEITTVAHGGDGIGRIDEQVCFVPYALPGDTVSVSITRKTKNALWAKIEKIVSPSPDRTQTSCPVYGECGACSWLHYKYPAQAQAKKKLVTEALARVAGIETDVKWVEDSDLRLGYRTRAEFHGDGEKLGFHRRGSHEIVDIRQCPLCHPKLNEALTKLREVGVKGGVTVTVNPEADDGEEVLVWSKFSKRKLKQYFPLAQTPKTEGGRMHFAYAGIPVVNGTFAQSSLLLNRLLIKETHAALGTPVSVLDLYCGSGNLSLTLPKTIEVIGMDHNKYGVKAADLKRKGAYLVGGEVKMKKLIAKGEVDTILLDPPRAGAKALVPALADSNVRAIVYVSCDPPSLARDLKILTQANWKLTQCTALDLFPNTPHVETVCRLERT